MCTITMSIAKAKKPATMTILWCCLALLYASVQAQQNPVVEIDPPGHTAVRVGQNLTILCRVAIPIDLCRVEIPPPSTSGRFLKPNQPPSPDGIDYFGDSLESGQCGVRIAHIKEVNDGIFKCSVVPKGSSIESSATTRIIVAKPPSNPELIVTEASRGRHVYEKGQKITISCSAKAGRPAANVSLFLDNEPLGNDQRPSTTVWDSNVDDNSLAVKNVSRVLDWFDNGKTLRCVANHIALDRPLTATQQLEVQFAPQPQSLIERFGFTIGQPGTVNVTVHANPRPQFIWHINDETIAEGRPDNSNRIQPSTAVELGKGLWLVELRIDSVQKSDTEKKYILEARNPLGSYEYQIVLSTSSEPVEGISNRTTSPHAHAGAFSHYFYGVPLDAGSIIGIVVGVLVLLLIVFLIVFARATGRWCFAGGSSSRTVGESSDTESAGRYSRSEVDSAVAARRRRPKMTFSQLFKRNKDKVSGADTDTIRTVVTVDDEKMQTSEAPSGATLTTANPSVGEGGLVYAELDLTQRKNAAPRRIDDDTTEYAEIIYTKPEAEEAANNANK